MRKAQRSPEKIKKLRTATTPRRERRTLALSTSTDAALGRALRTVEASELVALDLETTGLSPRKDRLRLVQVSDGAGNTHVLDAWKRNRTITLRSLFEAVASKPVIAHGAAFEWMWIYHLYDVELLDVRDTMLLSQLVALGEVAERYLGVRLDKEMQAAGWDEERLPERKLRYAAMDVQVLHPLYAALSEEVAELGLERVAAIENACLPSVARMKLAGMPVDRAAWDALAEENAAKFKALEREMLEAEWLPPRAPVPQTWSLAGADCAAMLKAAGLDGVTGTKAKDLKPHVGNELVDKLLAYRTTKGEAERKRAKDAVLALAPAKPSVPAEPWSFGSPPQVLEMARAVLEELRIDDGIGSSDKAVLLRYADQHPFFSKMLDHRSVKKLCTTYGSSWFKEAYDPKAGRVYPAWWQIGTSTGRFSCSAPNAQQLPPGLRKFFRAPAGRTFVNVDYSQIEVRVAAKMFDVKELLRIFREGEDVYRTTAAAMPGIALEDVTDKQRKLAKSVVLGLLYGLSAKSLPEYAFTQFGIKDMSAEEAAEHVNAFYDVYPELKEYHENTTAELYDAEGAGVVDRATMTGRRRDNITARNEAINAPVQGTAADGLKAAMALVHERLRDEFGGSAYIIATIHDELLVECDEADGDAVLELVESAMLEAMDAIVNAEGDPVLIEVEGAITKTWTKG